MDVFLQPISAPPRLPLALRAAVAIGVMAAALGLSVLFRPLVAPAPFILFFAAVAINAAYGGLAIGIASALVSPLLSNYFLVAPYGTFSLDADNLVRGAVFVFVASLISWLGEGRRQAAQQAYAQAERFYVTLASIGDGVIATDAAGRVAFLNAVAEKLTGWTSMEATGRDIADVFHIVQAETRQPAENPVARVLREGGIVGLANHTILIARDGVERPIDDSGAPIRDGRDQLIGVVLVFRDDTERVRAMAERERLLDREQSARAAAEAAVRVRDQFLSIAAHELKTPLTSLTGQAQLLQRRVARDGRLSDRERRTIDTVNAQVRRLNRMVMTLLDVSRIETGQLSIERAPLDLCALARRVVGEIQPMLDDRAVALECPDAPLMVLGDELRLEQVIQNLIQNALKYSEPPAPIRVTVTSPGDEVCVAVRDEGIGIPASALDRLFTRFYRAENAEGRSVGGLGIGLYVVKEVVSLHGGDVTVESVEGAGSTFTIRLPRLVAADPDRRPLATI